jgi:hypothetical protein
MDSENFKIEDLFPIDEIEKLGTSRSRMCEVRSGESVFEDLKIKMVMRIYCISRELAKRHVARRKKEVEAARRRRQAEAEKNIQQTGLFL